MTRERLSNSRWGYESSCFVCDERNENGLGLEFFRDGDKVEASFSLGEAFTGAPTMLHGGILLAVMDEVMAWACIALEGQWALTATSSAQFHVPVMANTSYRVVGEITKADETEIHAEARILDESQVCCTAAQARFHPLGEAKPLDEAGEDVGLEKFLRD